MLILCVVLCKAFHSAESAFSGSKHGLGLVLVFVAAVWFGVGGMGGSEAGGVNGALIGQDLLGVGVVGAAGSAMGVLGGMDQVDGLCGIGALVS